MRLVIRIGRTRVHLEAIHIIVRGDLQVDAGQRQVQIARERQALAGEVIRKFNRLEHGVPSLPGRIAVVHDVGRDAGGKHLVANGVDPDGAPFHEALELDRAPSYEVQAIAVLLDQLADDGADAADGLEHHAAMLRLELLDERRVARDERLRDLQSVPEDHLRLVRLRGVRGHGGGPVHDPCGRDVAPGRDRLVPAARKGPPRRALRFARDLRERPVVHHPRVDAAEISERVALPLDTNASVQLPVPDLEQERRLLEASLRENNVPGAHGDEALPHERQG